VISGQPRAFRPYHLPSAPHQKVPQVNNVGTPRSGVGCGCSVLARYSHRGVAGQVPSILMARSKANTDASMAFLELLHRPHLTLQHLHLASSKKNLHSPRSQFYLPRAENVPEPQPLLRRHHLQFIENNLLWSVSFLFTTCRKREAVLSFSCIGFRTDLTQRLYE
jgi:hypothetical protein